MGGRFAAPDELPAKHRPRPLAPPPPHALSVPVNFPSFTLNPLSVKAFNALYHGKAPQGISANVVTYNTFFYPLDAIHNWNRIYGKRGFIQYQFVIPLDSAAEGLPKVLQTIAASGQGSFLAVLKLFGKQEEFAGNISFPREGYTLALDFPLTGKLFPLLDRLDAMVLDHGGRHYLAKDARMAAEVFAAGYGDALRQFLAVKARLDPQGLFASAQSRRLGLTR
jgi:FAD/FMN-containing dehydrogenase